MDLQQSIIYLLGEQTRTAKTPDNCREIAMSKYSPDIIANRYIDLYEKHFA